MADYNVALPVTLGDGSLNVNVIQDNDPLKVTIPPKPGDPLIEVLHNATGLLKEISTRILLLEEAVRGLERSQPVPIAPRQMTLQEFQRLFEGKRTALKLPDNPLPTGANTTLGVTNITPKFDPHPAENTSYILKI